MPSLPAHPVAEAATATQLLSQPIADSNPNVEQLRRGQYLVTARRSAMSCHVRDGGEPLAGGLGLRPHLSVIICSPNITIRQECGIGNWTADSSTCHAPAASTMKVKISTRVAIMVSGHQP